MSDPADIRNWLRLSERVTTSGRLQPGDPQRLAAIGVKHVINLAMPDHPEALPNDEAVMRAADLRYTHIPVPFDAPDEHHYRAFAATLDADDRPVHVHCIMNFRVSAFFYRYHRDHGMSEAEARALMEQIWTPHTTDHPDVKPWRAFVTGER